VSATLALWGGRPAVDTPAPHFSWPPLTDAAITAVLQQLRTSISIYDRSGVIADLEDALAGYHDTAHALLTSSGTAALHSAYAACGLGQGDEVIVSAYTFLATATPLLHLGATPVLVDCEDSGNIDPYLVEQAITTRTRAIVVTHMWGYPADIIALRDIASRLGVWLIEDGSHAHGASVDGRKVGTFGHLAAFSMNGPKPLSAGEGGFLLTNDDELYHRALLHGHYNKRCRTEIPANHPLHRYATTGMGLKFRIHPLAAAIALDQLGRLDEYLSGRATIAEYMAGELRAMPGIQVQTPAPNKNASWYGLIIDYQPQQAHDVPIDVFYQALHAEGCREVDRPGSTCPLNHHPLFQHPQPLLPHYPGKLACRVGDFPTAERVHSLSLKLPVWHRDDDMPLVDDYLEAFGKITSNYTQLTRTNS
jgi:perosamine synthetase